jgi:hypothetical protein
MAAALEVGQQPGPASRRGPAACFALTASEIVREARSQLAHQLEDAQCVALAKLPKEDVAKVADLVVASFIGRKMGLRELESVARKELTIRVIRQSVDRYREGLLAGDMGPIEYFKRFYIRHFVRGGLAANAICVVDPNLHRVAKKLEVYPEITKSLDAAIESSAPNL